MKPLTRTRTIELLFWREPAVTRSQGHGHKYLTTLALYELTVISLRRCNLLCSRVAWKRQGSASMNTCCVTVWRNMVNHKPCSVAEAQYLDAMHTFQKVIYNACSVVMLTVCMLMLCSIAQLSNVRIRHQTFAESVCILKGHGSRPTLHPLIRSILKRCPLRIRALK